MAIIVRPEITIENPFGAIASYIAEDVLPLIVAVETNKKQIQRLSDIGLTDYSDVLKQHVPELLTEDNKIDWDKVEEYAQSDDPTKQKIALFLESAKSLRKDFAEASLYEKLQMLDSVGQATSPDQLRKLAVVGKGLKRVLNVIEKSNAPDDVKLWFALNHGVFYDRPEILELILRMFKHTEERPTEQKSSTEEQQAEQKASTSWDLSNRPKTAEDRIKEFLPKLPSPTLRIKKSNILKTKKQQKRERKLPVSKPSKQQANNTNEQQTTNEDIYSLNISPFASYYANTLPTKQKVQQTNQSADEYEELVNLPPREQRDLKLLLKVLQMDTKLAKESIRNFLERAKQAIENYIK